MAIVHVSGEDGSMMRFGKIAEMDRSFDIEFWQKQTSEERFLAVCDLVISYHSRNGKKADDLRRQRNIENFQRKSG
jgi:hypothetical protein